MFGLETIDFFDIVERFQTFQNPTSADKLDRLIEYCDITDGQRILDVGCGKGWLLRRIAAEHAVDAVGLELRQSFIDEAQAALRGAALRGTIDFRVGPAGDFECAPGHFDVAMCVGASFAIGTFEALLTWLRPMVKPGGMLVIGDIYARELPLPNSSAVHFSGGAERTLAETIEVLDGDGLSLVGLLDSSLDDWDRYESLHWYAADRWLRENPAHPEREKFARVSARFKRDHLMFDRDALGWALFACRVDG